MTSDYNVRDIIDQVMQNHGFRHHYEVADHFGVTAQTLSGWLKNNVIPHKHMLTIQNEIELDKSQEVIEDFLITRLLRILQTKAKLF